MIRYLHKEESTFRCAIQFKVEWNGCHRDWFSVDELFSAAETADLECEDEVGVVSMSTTAVDVVVVSDPAAAGRTTTFWNGTCRI